MVTRKSQGFITLFFAFWTALPAAAVNKSDWAEGRRSGADGATRQYYNGAAKLPWKHFMGDWRDQLDVAQGDSPYAAAKIIDSDEGRFIEWDVTRLVREWIAKTKPNQGVLLRPLQRGGIVVFASREHDSANQRPRLELTFGGKKLELPPAADTYLAKSTYRSQGDSPTLRVSLDNENALLRFDLNDLGDRGANKLEQATLRIYTTRQYGDVDVGVFRCQQGHDDEQEQIRGLSAEYPSDVGVAEHPDAIFAADFESQDWADRWSYAGIPQVIDTVNADNLRSFKPLTGKALRVKIAKGSTGALNTLFKFAKEGFDEPEEIYFRYYLRLGADWRQTLQGGKMPGISGTYGVAGWGGRKSDGTDGWSARGHFGMSIPKDNPLGGLHPIGTYCYHADMAGTYGDVWGWHRGYRGFLESNRWYAIEQHLKLNTPGKKDGVLRAWVDGRPAFEKRDIRFRKVAKLKIEQIWMNIYHGGTKPSPYDQHAFIDNVVIARRYIGPGKFPR